MIFAFLTIFAYLVSSINDVSKCNDPEGSIILTKKSHGDQEYKNSLIYSCEQELINQIKTENCILNIYRCIFMNSKIVNKDGVIHISINNQIQSNLGETIEIQDCKFYNSNGGAIYIDSNTPKLFNIVGCHFESCISEMNKFSVIFFKASNGNIERCNFLNNLMNIGSGGDIYYEYNLEGDNKGEKLTINGNTFERKFYILEKEDCLFYFTYIANSKLDFINNKFAMYKKATLFDCTSPLTEINNWKFENNCLTSKNDVTITIKSSNADKLPIDESIGKCSEFNCEPKPNGYENFGDDRYKYSCHEVFDFTKVEANDQCILSLHYCIFYWFMGDPQGGAVYVSTKSTIGDITEPFKFYNCEFNSNSADQGGSIYIESAETSRLFDFKDCYFTDNQAKNEGANIYIKALSSFQFTNCVFLNGHAVNGAGMYYYHSSPTSSSSSKKLLEENNYDLKFTNCRFQSNIGDNHGGALAIITDTNSQKSIEINNCLFIENYANETDADEEHGGAIYFKLTSSSNQYKSLLEEPTLNYALHITGCKFNNNDVSYFGGAIYLSIENGEQARSIGIDHCIFDHNHADHQGSDIYFTFNSATSSKSLLEEKVALRVNECNFENSQADGYGSVYLSSKGQSGSKNVEVSQCSFINCKSKDKGTLEVMSSDPSISYDLLNCNFNNVDSPIHFSGSLGKIESCHFIESNNYAICYESPNNEAQQLTVNGCEFQQEKQLNFLVNIETKENSKLSFTSNKVTIKNEVTRVFGTTDADGNTEPKGELTFDKNTIVPNDEKYLKDDSIKDLNIGCGNGFNCNSDENQVECPPNPDLSNYNYICDLSYDGSAGFDAINCVLGLFFCTFNKAMDTTSKVGAVRISTSVNFAEIKEPTQILNCTFNFCKATKGAAISIETSESSRLIEIANCTFDSNEAYEYGIIYIKAQDANIHIHDCEFSQNTNGVIFYDFHVFNTAKETDDFSLYVYDCSFKQNNAEKYGAIHININDTRIRKKFEIARCNFVNCVSENGGSISMISNSLIPKLHVTNCDFIESSSIIFKATTATIEKCTFTDSAHQFIYDNIAKIATSLPTEDQKLTIDDCDFIQNKELYSIFLIFAKAPSKLLFSNNRITITNDKTYVFDSIDNNKQYDNIKNWVFISNNLSPPDKKLFKTEEAEDLPAKCEDFNFTCPLFLPDCENNTRCDKNGKENEPSFINVSYSEFNNLKNQNNDDKNGAAIHIVNYGMTGIYTTFNKCEAENGCGGGIYIYIDTHIEFNVLIEKYTFTECRAIYGGGIYAFCNDEKNEIRILRSTFESNHASLAATEANPEFGGSSIYFSVKRGNILRCKFLKNDGSGVKLFTIYDNAKLLSKETNSLISFVDCLFESGEQSTSSLFYSHENENKVPIIVEDCIFTGKLAKNAHHIDGYLIDNNKEISKIQIKSCKFNSDKLKAINSASNLAQFDINSLVFNYNDKMKMKYTSNHYNLHIANVMIGCSIFIAVVAIIAVTINHQKKKDSDNIDISNEFDTV